MIEFQSIRSAELNQFLEVFQARSTFQLDSVKSLRDALELKTTIYNDLKTKLKALKKMTDDFSQTGSLSAFGAKTVSVSDESILRISAGGGSSALSHSIHVDQLARAHSVLSDRYTQTGTELSAAHAGTKNFSITVDGTQYDVSVVINSGDDNQTVLKSVVDAINAVDDIEAVGSSINDTDTTTKLSITSEETGTKNKMTFTDTDGLLASLGVTNTSAATDTAGGYIYQDSGGSELDAKLTVDGINIVRSSNTLTDVVAGATLELLGAQEATDPDVSVSIAVDTEAITAKVQEFLDAFNDAHGYITAKVNVDPTTYARGDLAGDSPYVNLWQNLRSSMANSVPSSSSEVFSALSQIGITSGATGNFSITNTSNFDDALNENLDAVEALFNASDGIAVRLEELLDNYTDVSGIIDSSKNSVTDRVDLLDNKIDRLERLQAMEEKRLIEQYGAIQEATILNQSILQMVNSLYSGF